MVPFDTEVTIRRPVADVFAYVSDPGSFGEWMGGVTRSELLTKTTSGVGTKVRLAGKMGLWNFDTPLEVTEYVPNRTLGIKSSMPGLLDFEATLKFESTDARTTRLVSSGTYRLQGLWRLMEPLFAGEFKGGEAKELQKIKTHLERAS